jgi:hypothetical protein
VGLELGFETRWVKGSGTPLSTFVHIFLQTFLHAFILLLLLPLAALYYSDFCITV